VHRLKNLQDWQVEQRRLEVIREIKIKGLIESVLEHLRRQTDRPRGAAHGVLKSGEPLTPEPAIAR